MNFSKIVFVRYLEKNRLTALRFSICRNYSQSAPATEVKFKKQPHSDKEKKPNKPLFIEDLFCGKFEREILTYPELTNERLESLNRRIKPIDTFFEEKVDSKLIDSTASIPTDVMDELKHLKLFGLLIPEIYGGQGLTWTEYAKVTEAFGKDLSIFMTLSAHQIYGTYGLLIAGTAEQKQKYLPRLATGEWIAALCVSEETAGNDFTNIKLTAELSSDAKTWILNGSKTWVTNGSIANLFSVFAKTAVTVKTGQEVGCATAFLVERDFPGITFSENYDTFGIKGTKICTVNFQNTPVPTENILGDINGGHELCVKILSGARHTSSMALAGLLRKMITVTSNHLINRNQFGVPLYEFENVQYRIAKLTNCVYAIESMVYLTTSFLDLYDNPDYAAESAILKVYSTESCFNGLNECLQLLGCQSYRREFPYERYLRDLSTMTLAEGSNDVVRSFISMRGLQNCGKTIHDKIKSVRNPFFHPTEALKYMIERIGSEKEIPPLRWRLKECVHPSLMDLADHLEYGIIRLQYTAEKVLMYYGMTIHDRQILLCRFADIAIQLYAMTAVMGRVSRSYCIGVQDANHEVLIASTFCMEAYEKVDRILKEITSEMIHLNDLNYLNIGRRVFHTKHYFPQHPLTNNY